MRQYGLKSLVYQCRFTGTTDTGNNCKDTKRELDINIFQIVASTSVQYHRLAIRPTTLSRYLYTLDSIQIIGRDCIAVKHFFGRTLKHHLATLSPSFGTDVNYPISRSHHIFIMLDYDYSIPQVTQFFKRIDEPLIITLMKADTWLIKDIQNIDKPCSDLRGQPYALAFSTREGCRLTIKRQIVKAHI